MELPVKSGTVKSHTLQEKDLLLRQDGRQQGAKICRASNKMAETTEKKINVQLNQDDYRQTRWLKTMNSNKLHKMANKKQTLNKIKHDG